MPKVGTTEGSEGGCQTNTGANVHDSFFVAGVYRTSKKLILAPVDATKGSMVAVLEGFAVLQRLVVNCIVRGLK